MSFFDDIYNQLDNIYEGGKLLVPFVKDLQQENMEKSTKLTEKITKYNKFIGALKELVLSYEKLQIQESNIAHDMAQLCTGDKNDVASLIVDVLKDVLGRQVTVTVMTYVIGRITATWIVYQTGKIAALDAAGVAVAVRQTALRQLATRVTTTLGYLSRIATTAAIALTVYDLWRVGKDHKEMAEKISNSQKDLDDNLKSLETSIKELVEEFDKLCRNYVSGNVLRANGEELEFDKLEFSMKKLMSDVVKDDITSNAYEKIVSNFIELIHKTVRVITSIQLNYLAALKKQDGDLQTAYKLLCRGVSINDIKYSFPDLKDIIPLLNKPEIINSGWEKISIEIQRDGTKRIIERKSNFYKKSWEVGGSSGEEFTDNVDSKKLTGLIVRHGDVIDAIQGIYDGQKGELHGSTTGGQEQIIEFLPDEYITEVEVSVRSDRSFNSSDVINGLAITTNKQTYSKLGKGNSFKKYSGSVAGFYGRAGSYVFQIGFLEEPKVEVSTP